MTQLPVQPQLPDTLCYLNGEYTALKDAKISVLDRGFIFGDGIYEVVPAYEGKPFRFAQHMARLDRSLGELRITNPLSHLQWREIINRLMAAYAQSASAASPGNQIIYIQVSRGVAMRDHPMLPGLTPTVFVMTNTMKLPTAAATQQKAWPASRPTTSAGKRPTSKAPACWARCSRGRSASMPARWRPSCSAAII